MQIQGFKASKQINLEKMLIFGYFDKDRAQNIRYTTIMKSIKSL